MHTQLHLGQLQTCLFGVTGNLQNIRQNLLSCGGYFNDTCDKFDDNGSETTAGLLTESSNEGFKKGKNLFEKSK